MRGVVTAIGLFVAAVTLAACGGDDDDPWEEVELGTEGLRVLVVSSVRVTGENRLVLGVLRDGTPIEEATLGFEVFNLNDEPTATSTGELRYTPVEDLGRGYYVGMAAFDEAGAWGIEVTDAGGEVARTQFGVADDVPQPMPGDAALRTESRTIHDTPLDELTTDTEPDEALYQMTVAEAVSSGVPAVIAFASPALCQTQTCGPAVDIIKHIRGGYAGDVNFVHVEVFENLDSAEPTVVAAVEEWDLRTEPWIYVVGVDGVITAAFEGLVGEEELLAAIDGVLP